jgi:uncharacterized membrane protein
MRKLLQRLLTYFLQGVLIAAPILLTLYLIYWLFNAIDNLLPINLWLDNFINKITKEHHTYPGVGFLAILLLLIIIGYLSSNFITKKLFVLFEKLFEKAPGVKIIYTTIKDFFEAFAGNKRKFTKPVRVLMRHNPPVWQIGFITQDNLDKLHIDEFICVYLPHSYAVSGVTVFVSKENIVPLQGISAANAMKMAISGGVAGYDDEAIE